MFDPRLKIIDLLHWIKEQGLWPKHPEANSLWVIPIANTIRTYRDLLPHQKEMALWLPSEADLKRILEEIGYEGFDFVEVDGVHFVVLGKKPPMSHGGVGVGKTEAILSALNAMRREIA